MYKMATRVERGSESDSSLPLDMSAGSSSFEVDDSGMVFGTQPYLFEPELESDEASEASDQPFNELAERLGRNDWCTCGNCPHMDTESESVCCQEISQVLDVLDEDAGKKCITEHHGFHPVCLHQSVLRTAYYVYRQQYEDLPETNGRLRYIGYRQMARWCWGWLGKQVRVPLPACAVSKIRNTYPEENGQYRGFTAS